MRRSYPASAEWAGRAAWRGGLLALLLLPAGVRAQVVVSTVAGTGTAGLTDGPAATARFNLPQGLLDDGQGALYVADTYNHSLRRFSAAGVVSTLAGTGAPSYVNSPNPRLAAFSLPRGMVLDSAGNLYVADTGNGSIRRLDAATGAVTTLAGDGTPGYQDGPGPIARFDGPANIVRDARGNLYVSDANNYRIRKVDPGGNVTTLAGSGIRGYQDGPAATARFFDARGMTFDGAGNLLIADRAGHRIRMLTPAGVVSTVAGTGTAGFLDGPAAQARFNGPQGLAVDGAGNIYVSDTQNHRLRRIAPNGQVSTVAGSGAAGFADGPAATARFLNPYDLCWVAASATLYVADYGNHRVRRLTGLPLAARAGAAPAAPARLYPNPAREAVRLAWGPASAGPVRVTLRDALGRAVRSWTSEAVPGQFSPPLSLAGLPAGVYLCQLTGAGLTSTQRLCIEP